MHIYKNRQAERIKLSLGVELGTDKMHCSMIFRHTAYSGFLSLSVHSAAV